MANPYQKKSLRPQTMLIVGVIVLILLFVTILLLGRNDASVDPKDNQTTVETLQTEQNEKEPVPVTKTKELEGMCEDYSFNQGDIAELEQYTLSINRIGRTGVILTVNDQQVMLSEADDEQIEGLLVELAEGDILYFGGDDPDNTVLLRLGCQSSSENPADKYVREKGQAVCQRLVTACQNEFNIEEE